MQVQTKSVFRSASLNKASTLQCLRSRSQLSECSSAFLRSASQRASLTGRERPNPSVSNLRAFDDVQIPGENRGSSADHTTGASAESYGGPDRVKRTSPDTAIHEQNGYAKVYDDNNIFMTNVDNCDTTYTDKHKHNMREA